MPLIFRCDNHPGRENGDAAGNVVRQVTVQVSGSDTVSGAPTLYSGYLCQACRDKFQQKLDTLFNGQ